MVTNRIVAVAAREMPADHELVQPLAERLPAECGEREVDGVGRPILGESPLGGRLDRVEAQLTQPLPLELEPLVVPVRQEVTLELLLINARLVDIVGTIEDTPRRQDELVDVDDDRPREPNVGRGRLHDRVAGLPQPPEGRAKVRARTLLVRVEPE